MAPGVGICPECVLRQELIRGSPFLARPPDHRSPIADTEDQPDAWMGGLSPREDAIPPSSRIGKPLGEWGRVEWVLLRCHLDDNDDAAVLQHGQIHMVP